MRRLALLVLALLLASCGRRRVPPPTAEPPPEAPPSSAPAEPPPHGRRGGMDVTFLVTGDTHFGFEAIEDTHKVGLAAMTTLEGTAYPAAIGGSVGRPIGLLVAGDLTEQGRPHEWARFETVMGALPFPVYEGIGNHDRWQGTYVQEQVARRHGAARYAWDWQDIHLVCLGEAPNDADLAWLRGDLARVDPEVGVILFFHFPVAGPSSAGNWFGDHERQGLAEILAGRQVLGIFSGHHHAPGMYRWHGYDGYLSGSAKHAWHSFSVVHVTDQRMTVASWNYDRRAFWWWHDKPIFGARGREARWFGSAPGLVGAP